MSATTPTSGSVTVDALTEILKAINKDSTAAFRGDFKTQGASIQGTMGAYLQLEEAAKSIKRIVVEARNRIEDPTPKPKTIVLQAGDDVTELAEYRVFLERVDNVQETLAKEIKRAEEVLDPPSRQDYVAAIAFGPVLGAALSAALHFGALFLRRDVTETHGPVDIEDRVLVDAVGRALRADRSHEMEMLLPTAVALLQPLEDGLPARFRAIEKQAQELRGLLGRIEQRLKLNEPAEPENEHLAELKPRVEAAIRSFDALGASMAAMAGRLFRADALQAKLSGGGWLLALRVLAAGGGTRVEVVTGGNDVVEHSGGVIVGYALMDVKGDVTASDVVMRYGASIGIAKVTETMSRWRSEEVELR